MFHSELLGLIHLDPAQEILAPLLLVICMVYPVLEFVGAYTQKGPTITAQKEESMDEESTEQGHFPRYKIS